MKNSLWMIIALVTGIVGFLIGYSVAGFTGSRGAAQVAAHGTPAAQEAAPAGAPAAHKADAGGYAGAGGTAHGGAAGGYGGAQKPPPAVPAAQKVAEKPKAAGY